MADRLTKCPACGGLGYFRCYCWPGDCICGQDEDTCFECEGEGLIDPTYDDDFGVPFDDDAPVPPSQERAGDAKSFEAQVFEILTHGYPAPFARVDQLAKRIAALATATEGSGE